MTGSPKVGHAETVALGVRRILAPNPSPMTYWGTNSYLVGQADRIAVIDPGPEDPAHIKALLDAAGAARIAWILVTHAHRDHTLGVPALAKATGAPVFGFGAATAGRSPVMARLAKAGLTGGGEGVDRGFEPDHKLGDGARIEGADFTLTAHWTPGHFAGHLAFGLNDTVFTGDLVMGWASTLISPPDGDQAAFMASCEALLSLGYERALPGHGAAVDDLPARIRWLMQHRRARETAILDALDQGRSTIGAITAQVYQDVTPALLSAAERNVFAHLIDLVERNLVRAEPELGLKARFSPVRTGS